VVAVLEEAPDPPVVPTPTPTPTPSPTPTPTVVTNNDDDSPSGCSLISTGNYNGIYSNLLIFVVIISIIAIRKVYKLINRRTDS